MGNLPIFTHSTHFTHFTHFLPILPIFYPYFTHFTHFTHFLPTFFLPIWKHMEAHGDQVYKPSLVLIDHPATKKNLVTADRCRRKDSILKICFIIKYVLCPYPYPTQPYPFYPLLPTFYPLFTHFYPWVPIGYPTHGYPMGMGWVWVRPLTLPMGMGKTVYPTLPMGAHPY